MTMTLVSTVTVGAGGAASIDFTSIPQTGTDLLVVFSGRKSDTSRILRCNFNGDTGSNYSRMFLYGDGSSAASTATSAQTTLFTSNALTASTDTSSTFNNTSIYIPNYTSSIAKSVSTDVVTENNATQGFQLIQAGLWSGTAAITSISFGVQSGTFVEYSTASLYTITKGSGGATVS